MKQTKQHTNNQNCQNSSEVLGKSLMDKLLWSLVLHKIREANSLNKQQAKGNALAKLQSQYAKKPKNPV
ncbi:MAG: hypothetical protein J0I09_00625 [Sphingobacteriia bacterium]|nr:hypothetical protein [Sphingobacteriia bacterium]